MADWGDEFSFFKGIHVRIDTRIDISISTSPMIVKIGKQYINKIWLEYD